MSALADWPDSEFADDRDRCLFIATVKRKPMAELRVVSPAAGYAEGTVPGTTSAATEEVAEEVSRLVRAQRGEIKRAELQAALGLRHQVHFREAYLLPALAAGLVEMTQPDKPNRSKQRYRLTAKARALHKKHNPRDDP